MDRIWQWAWDRYGARYSWAVSVIAFPVPLMVYLPLSFLVVAFEKSGRYVDAAAVVVVAVMVLEGMIALPDRRWLRPAEQWAAGQSVDRATALESTYAYARSTTSRTVWATGVWAAVLSVVVGVIAGATGLRLIQYAILGAVVGTGAQLIAFHSILESMMRPVRAALAGDTGIGDSLPRPRPTFAGRSNVSMVAVAFVFAVMGVSLGAVVDRVAAIPVLSVVIGGALALGLAVPISVGLGFHPLCSRSATSPQEPNGWGPVTTTNGCRWFRTTTLGALAASVNRMQAGLAERQRLQAAFGTYVDPALAARLLEQGDDVFTGERREVTVMFVDIRDFTPFAEANTAEETVARLNALFEIVVPAVVDAGGHVNKFLGDGALAVFGAPNDLADHADAGVSAAVVIDSLVGERFGGALRIGIGINTGVVIAGTIGGGSKLEFTLIGGTVNVAARVEQLTKTTATQSFHPTNQECPGIAADHTHRPGSP